MKYIIITPDGKKTTKTAREGMTHAVVRLFDRMEGYTVSFAGSRERAEKERTNKGGSMHTVLLELTFDGQGDATNPSHVLTDSEHAEEAPKSPQEPTVDLQKLWADAFQAGKNYGLQCAFKGVKSPPVNPYS